MADRDTVRLLTGATTGDASDDQIDALLTEEGGIVKLAAADLLEVMAGRLIAFESDDAKIDGSKQAVSLRAQAASLRTQHYEHGGDFYFDTACGPDYQRHHWTGYEVL